MPNTHRFTRGLALIAAAGLAACGGSEADGPAAAVDTARRVPVRTAPVETRDLSETLVLTGTLEPRAEVQVVAELSARLQRTLRNEGDRVAQGALVAVLDDTDYRLARDRAGALLDLATANQVHAAAERDRADSLVETGGITARDHLSAQLAVQVAEASVAQATVELAITEQQVARSQVTAPIAGRIARKLADAGAMLVPGAPIYTIVDDAVLELRASVPSADYHKVRIGEAVSVQVDALPGEAVVGEVTRIAPIVDARTRAFDVVVRVPGGSLVTGLFARAEVRVRELPGSLTVPPAALVRDGADPARATAFVVVADSTAERRDVGVGVETSDAVQVTSGLSVGERVVVDPPAALGPGTPVDVQP